MIAYSDPFRGSRRMPADAYRDGDHYVLHVELPGVDPGSIDVKVDDRLLTIRAERASRGADGATWITRERWTGAVERRFSLGRQVDTAAIAADYENGVLSVVLPIAETAKRRSVAVTTGATAERASEVATA